MKPPRNNIKKSGSSSCSKNNSNSNSYKTSDSETNKEKGNTSLGVAIAYYSSNGYTVSIPLNDTQDYDLIVDKTIS